MPPPRDDLDRQILSNLRQQGPGGGRELAEHFGIPFPDMLARLGQLRKAGLVAYVNRVWLVLPQKPEPQRPG